ncbi:hypothetical protein A2U01_0071278, partial [Trifolium medium]|nr:hypothetical protein [Trifolium medium]
DAARKKLEGAGLKYNELKAAFDDYKNNYALQVDLVKARNEQIAGLEEKLRTIEVTTITEEEKKMDPDGAYAGFSRV